MQTTYILVVSGDSCWIPYRFWIWEIMSEDELNKRMSYPNSHAHWHPYQGSWSSVPTEVQHRVEAFEKTIGYAIKRPSASGDRLVMIGK